MRLLLVNPPIYDFTAYDFWLKPYGVLRVAGMLRGRAEMALFDYLDRRHPAMQHAGMQPSGIPASDAQHAARRRAPRADAWGRGEFASVEVPKPPALAGRIARRFRRFGLPQSIFHRFLAANPPFDFALVQTGMTWWYPGVQEVIADLRSLAPKTRIVLGGPYASICPEHAASLGADLVVRGPDVEPLWRLLGVAPNPAQPPCWELYPRLETGVLRLTDGCPFRCSYCSVPRVYPRFEPRPLDLALAELRLLQALGARNVAFYDDALLYQADKILVPFLKQVQGWQSKVQSPESKARSSESESSTPAIPNPETCALHSEPSSPRSSFIIHHSSFSFHTPNALHARFITRELAGQMVRAGFKTFYLGFESGSTEWQRQTGGKVEGGDLERAAANLVAAGADRRLITAYIIIGHPRGAAQQVEPSMRFVHGLGIRVMLSEFSPIPGTPDGDLCRDVVDLAEPLWHNKTAFTIASLGTDEVNRLKALCRELNGQA